ncbi:RNA recognition motif, partial [Trifolium medium]|nr:RNA recognition motif [Trifolium medium]
RQPSRHVGDGHVDDAGHGSKPEFRDQSLMLLDDCKTDMADNAGVKNGNLGTEFKRKGFEVCGILEDVFVPKKRNMSGEPYGFVRFSNVKDVNKLLKALNAVCFGQFRIRA